MVGSELHQAIGVVVSAGLPSGTSAGFDIVNVPLPPPEFDHVPFPESQPSFVIVPVWATDGHGVLPAHDPDGEGLVADHVILVVPEVVADPNVWLIEPDT